MTAVLIDSFRFAVVDLGITNAQKLSLPANTPVGTRVQVTDGFVVANDAGSGLSTKGLYIQSGTQNSRPKYSPSSPNDPFFAAGDIGWDGVAWSNGDGVFTNDDVAYPWLGADAHAAHDGYVMTHPAVQELTAPSTAQGGVFVSGGSQDGIYTDRGYADAIGVPVGDHKKVFGLLGVITDDIVNSVLSVVVSQSSVWNVYDADDNLLYYSLSDVATPDLAGSDKFVMAVSGVAYSKRGTFNGKSYYNVIGQSTSTSLSAIFWSSATWHITNAIGVDVDTSTSAVATPDLATFLLGTVVTNVAWLNANDDSPASITVTSVTQGELDAGVLVAGAGTSVANAKFQLTNGVFEGLKVYADVLGVASNIDHETNWQDLAGYYYGPGAVAFPWQATWLQNDGALPAPTVTRDDVASEANWSVV